MPTSRMGPIWSSFYPLVSTYFVIFFGFHWESMLNSVGGEGSMGSWVAWAKVWRGGVGNVGP